MARLEDRTINQILLQVIGPMLIACMVGSLVFFFIEVLYRGPHTARLYWVMGLFSIAAVLVSRISIDEGRERAQLFGLALGIATFVASLGLVEFNYAGLKIVGPIVVLALISIVMWTSAKLAWDCTVVDRSRDVSAMGLLEIVKRKLLREPTTVSISKSTGERSSDRQPSLFSFLWGASKKNTPGIWVFYFAIFAFPVFGIGQWFVQQESKSWIYVLFAVYLGSTLGLLMTTSLLGLERYLSQRNLHVPAAVGRNWLIVGSLFALLVVLTVMLLPRTGGSDSVNQLLAMFTSPDRSSSKLAIGKDGQQHREDAHNKRVDPDGEKPGDVGDQEQQDSDSRQSDEQESKSEQKPNPLKSEQQDDRKPDQNDDRAKRDPDDVRKQNSKKVDENARQQNGQQQERIEQQEADPRLDRQQRPAGSNRSGDLRNRMLETISSGLRWFTWLVGIGALFFLAWMFRNDLARLFGGFSSRTKSIEPAAEIAISVSVRLPAFASFRDPFACGKAESMSANQIAIYTMAALEAWGREFEIRRDLETTPHEYARSLAAIDSQLSAEAVEFAELYGRCAFSSETVNRVELKPLVDLWRRMAQPVAKPQIRQAVTANP